MSRRPPSGLALRAPSDPARPAPSGKVRRARSARARRTPVAATAWALVLAGCGLAPTPGAQAGQTPPAPLPPPGYGTLSQREISMPLRSGPLQLVVTPLHESVLVVTSPDTYRRLSSLAAPYDDLRGDGRVFLVSFYSDLPDVRFVPEEVQLMSQGIRVRPAVIDPLTPSWGEGRLRQRETAMAVYTFDRPVELESEVVLMYGLEQTDAWAAILPRIQAERGRARARAGVGQSSKPYFEIFR